VNAPPDPCRRYADWLCEEAKDTATGCGSARALALLLPPAACDVALARRAETTARLESMRASCAGLLARLCADLGPETAACRRLQGQRASLTPDRCHAVLEDYPRSLAQLRREEAALHPLTPVLRDRIAAGDGPSFGPKGAPVTMVLFTDFECPFCVKARDTAGAVYQTHGDRVRFVLRQLPAAIHQHAELAARASLEANAQGRFWPFHDAVFAHPGELDEEGLLRRAAEVGLDIERFRTALEANAHAEAVDADRTIADAAGVLVTPTLFLDGRRVDQPGDFHAVLAEVEAALAAADAALPPPPLPVSRAVSAPSPSPALAPALAPALTPSPALTPTPIPAPSPSPSPSPSTPPK
jgi:hypothetical protein